MKRDDLKINHVPPDVTDIEPPENPNRWREPAPAKPLPEGYSLSGLDEAAEPSSQDKPKGKRVKFNFDGENANAGVGVDWQAFNEAMKAASESVAAKIMNDILFGGAPSSSSYTYNGEPPSAPDLANFDPTFGRPYPITSTAQQSEVNAAERRLIHAMALGVAPRDAKTIADYWYDNGRPRPGQFWEHGGGAPAPTTIEGVYGHLRYWMMRRMDLENFTRQTRGDRPGEFVYFEGTPDDYRATHDYSGTARRPGESLKDEAFRKMGEDMLTALRADIRRKRGGGGNSTPPYSGLT